jgi:hypothetical protein
MYNFIGTLHHKNTHGIHLLKKAGMDIAENLRTTGPEDWNIYCNDIVPSDNPRTMYGPQIDFKRVKEFNTDHPVNFLSDWGCKLARTFNPTLNAVALPFPVDIDNFVPESRSQEPILYFKRIDYNLYKSVYAHFRSKFRNIKVFDYEKSYKEPKYKKAIANAPFTIWLGSHESQGFALQECLSSGSPIFVIDAKDLSEEVSRKGVRSWGTPGPFFPATSAPYFDERCGVKSLPATYKTDFDTFYANLSKYKPRDYVVENLSAQALVKRWTEVLK